MATLNLLDEARFKMDRATTPQAPTIGFLRERAIAADKRDRRKALRRRALTMFLIVAPYAGAIAMFRAYN